MPANWQGRKASKFAAVWVSFYLAGHLADLRAAFRQLLAHSYIDKRLLALRLRALGLPPL
jgi:hypothetical protein